MKRAVELTQTNEVSVLPAYDSTKYSIGDLMWMNTGPSESDKWGGPLPISLGRPMEASVAIPAIYPHAIQYSPSKYYQVYADNATAAATRRFVLYDFDKSTNTQNWQGFITVTFPTATNHTIRSVRLNILNHTAGTVAVSGTTVTGIGTTAKTDGCNVGSRIGFGSTDPNDITTWYELAAMTSNTSWTLTTSPGTIAAGTSYVIQEMNLAILTTNATTTNGGLFVVKGLRPDIFTPSGTNIPAATTVDNIRACYWLADAATVTNTTGGSLTTNNDTVSFTNRDVYVIDGTTSLVCFRYNLRAPLTGLTAGKSTAAFVYKTGAQACTGTCSLTNNGRIATASHGSGSGIPSLYFVTTTRVYRVPLTGIVNSSTTWLSTGDLMVEVPPGGTSTYLATGAMTSIEYSDSMDRFFIMTSGTLGNRSYVTRYNTSSSPFDHIFLADTKQLDQSTADSDGTIHPSIQALPFSIWVEGGIAFLARAGTTAVNNHIYTLPVGAHWTYADTTNQYIITPSLTTPNGTKLHRALVQTKTMLGTGTMGSAPEPYLIYYRTAGITDNSGAWSLLPDTGSLTGVSATGAIQFKFTFRVLGLTCIPAQVYNMTVVYEDNTTDSHYTPSTDKSVPASRIFAWRQSSLWSTTIPNMRVLLTNASTLTTIIDDNSTANSFGVFEYSTDGITWSPWSSSADTVGNYVRYTAASLPNGAIVKALLIQQ